MPKITSRHVLIRLDTSSQFDYIAPLYHATEISMFKIVGIQLVVTVALSFIAYIAGGFQAAFSLCLGGFSYLLPTLLSVLILKFSRSPVWAGVGFILSEGLKIILALALMVATFAFYREIQFLPYFIGLLSVSHLVLLLFLRVHRYGK